MNRPESGARRDGFVAGVPITLADGQAWHLPRPTLGLLPEVAEDGSIRFGPKRRFHFGADYDALVDAFAESTDAVEEANALLALAVDLLRRNYDLSAGDLRTLLPRWFGDEANAEMWREVADAAVGRAPKPTPVG